jgi:serine/threonine-protein kinase
MLQAREIPTALAAALDTFGKVTGRVRRRPIFYRQLKAEALAYVGQAEAASAAIEDAASLGLIDIVWVDRCPLFDALKDSPVFAKARARVAALATRVLDAFD